MIEYRKELLTIPDANLDEKRVIEKKISDREQILRPMYHQIAVHFADLHDTPERMHEKGVIQVI